LKYSLALLIPSIILVSSFIFSFWLNETFSEDYINKIIFEYLPNSEPTLFFAAEENYVTNEMAIGCGLRRLTTRNKHNTKAARAQQRQGGGQRAESDERKGRGRPTEEINESAKGTWKQQQASTSTGKQRDWKENNSERTKETTTAKGVRDTNGGAEKNRRRRKCTEQPKKTKRRRLPKRSVSARQTKDNRNERNENKKQRRGEKHIQGEGERDREGEKEHKGRVWGGRRE